jgi:D-galacturonate reductase
VGYGHRSVEAIIRAVHRVENSAEGLQGAAALARRREEIRALDSEGIIATPANSSYNELVVEAGRMSITSGGRDVIIEYGDNPRVRFKELSEYGK